MQPVRQLAHILETLAVEGEGLFALSDLRGALPDLGPAAFRVLVSRAEKQGLLQRICRGLYWYPRAQGLEPGLLLYRAAARLRADEFISGLSLFVIPAYAGIQSFVEKNGYPPSRV